MNASEPREDAVAVLPTKWRAAALRLEETAAGESPITWGTFRARAEVYHTRADELDAALAQQGVEPVAAPKEAGDDWADVALCLSNEVLPPMECPDTPDRWLAAMRRRLAAPSKEAGDGMGRFTVRQTQCDCHQETCCCGQYSLMLGDQSYATGSHARMHTLAAALNVIQQDSLNGAKWYRLYHAINLMLAPLVASGEIDTRGTEVAGVMDALSEIDGGQYNERLTAPQADQQGASLEGEPPRGWGIAGNYGDGKWRCFREGKPQTYLGNPQATRADAMAECHRLAALSKASPDDQRQEGDREAGKVAMAQVHFNGLAGLLPDGSSPPTEAAAAVGDILWRIDNEAEQFLDDKGMVYLRWLRERIAALSPTASAAREGSDG